ncbi:crotonobetainyl-CoA:carnitine CoA-transferase CaiB-like acyl-CoA transferase [Amycolatopsis bartoniae]|uniref:Dehydratase n=1 Tax=Amycolatopsis bartoniae TaxID=941986 RepID=A0A8H9J0T5_9PSEU|nr:CaiB/BaiF CoA-transferase family protein [Amycolatopsis bartoniae]MBB2935608.1 crotonobetainyl-CoA:carnitine CoA-transferase CaiB-like acyl-CoA transferase [Amycolatopsis bartoniae]TVT02062.1 CoA transferase [Amycolatopsis bartoniae]GHF60603.1 dehydratase [Amycolatopsis bartoniae]
MTLPLEGFTVVSLEQAVAAPFATRQLADQGARVLKIERVDGGDFARAYDTSVRGMGSHFVWLNRGKESVALDVKTGEGLALLRELIGRADVFVQNLAPGAAARLGLSAAELRAQRPELVVVDLSGYGSSGPYRDRKAYDLLVQSEGGLVSITGTPDAPAKTGIPTADIGAGMYAYSGVLAALLRRGRTGEGAHIEVAMLDAVAEWMGHPLYLAAYTGEQPPRTGLSHPVIAPYDAYPTADGEVLIGIQNDRGWRSLVTEVLGRPELAEDPEYATNAARVRNRSEVDATVAAATKGFVTEDLVARLDAAGIASARVNTVRELIEHPQLSERDRWRSVDTPVGPIRAVLPPATFADVEARMGAVPAHGQHTAAVLAELGRDPAAVADLAERGVVFVPE